ncbi:hypothetical protein OOJ91_12630 [Micromonospora lupini]|nr:hypothetical protein [Micromonospora lupini]
MNTPEEHPNETPPSSLAPGPSPPPAAARSRSRRGEKGRRKKSLDEQARDEGTRHLTDLRDYQPAEATYLVDELTRRHAIFSPQWWRTAHENGTLDDRINEVIAEYQAAREPGAGAAPAGIPGRRSGHAPFQNQPAQAYLDWAGQSDPEAA